MAPHQGTRNHASPKVRVSPKPLNLRGRTTRQGESTGQRNGPAPLKRAEATVRTSRQVDNGRRSLATEESKVSDESFDKLQGEDSSELSWPSDQTESKAEDTDKDVTPEKSSIKLKLIMRNQRKNTAAVNRKTSMTTSRRTTRSTSELHGFVEEPSHKLSEADAATVRKSSGLGHAGRGTVFHEEGDALSETSAATGQALQRRQRRPIGGRELVSLFGPKHRKPRKLSNASEMKSTRLRHQSLSHAHEHDDENAAQPRSHDVASIGGPSQEPGQSIASHEPPPESTGDVASIGEQSQVEDYREASLEEISLIQHEAPGSGESPKRQFEDVEMDDAASEESISNFHQTSSLSALIPTAAPAIQYPDYPDTMWAQLQPAGAFALHGQNGFHQPMPFPENPFLPSTPSNPIAQSPELSPGTMVRAKNRVPHVRRALNTACEACRKSRRRCTHEATPKSAGSMSALQNEQQPLTSRPKSPSPRQQIYPSQDTMDVSMKDASIQYQARDVTQEQPARTTDGSFSEPLGDGHPHGAFGTYTTFQVQQGAIIKDQHLENIPVDSMIDPQLKHNGYRAPVGENSATENTEDVTMTNGEDRLDHPADPNLVPEYHPTPETLLVDDQPDAVLVTSQEKDSLAYELSKHRKLLPRPADSTPLEASSPLPGDAVLPPQRKRPRKTGTGKKDNLSSVPKPAFESFDAALAKIQNLIHQEAFTVPSVKAAPKTPLTASQKKPESVASMARSASRSSTVGPSNNDSAAKSPSRASSAALLNVSSTPIPPPGSFRRTGPAADDSQGPTLSSPIQQSQPELVGPKSTLAANLTLTTNTPSVMSIKVSPISTTPIASKPSPKFETDIRGALSSAPAFHPKIGNAAKLLAYLDSQDVEYASTSRSQIRGYLFNQLRVVFAALEKDESIRTNHVGLLVGVSFAYTYVERISHALETWNKDDNPASVQDWAGKLCDIVKTSMVNYISAKLDEFPSDKLVAGLIPLALPSAAIFFWARFVDLRDLNIDALVQKPEFIMLYLDEEMTTIARAGFETSIRRMRETMADDLSERDFWTTHTIERVWADLAMEKLPLSDIYGNAIEGPFGRKEIEEWLETFRNSREQATTA